jgi:hypothetical protein
MCTLTERHQMSGATLAASEQLGRGDAAPARETGGHLKAKPRVYE